MKARLPSHSNNSPKNIIDKIEELAKEVRERWIEFRNATTDFNYEYDDIQKALELLFMENFNKIFQEVGKEKLSISLSQCFKDVCVGRGTILNTNEKPLYSRFIPDAKYIKNDNRFSPPGIEWLYLVIGDSDESIKKCAEKECKAKVNNRFGFCHFELLSQYANLKIINLTIADNLSYDEINDHTYTEFCQSCEKHNCEMPNKISDNILNSWYLLTLCKILSEKIFEPVENCNKKIDYKPFQTLAKYFEEQGYVGIKYKSTVFDKANNIVLFDKKYVKPCGDIIDYYVSE